MRFLRRTLLLALPASPERDVAVDRVARLGTVEGDDASRALLLANDFRVLVHERFPSFRPQACLGIKQGTRLPSMHGCLEPLSPP